jgi:hypothetical protein
MTITHIVIPLRDGIQAMLQSFMDLDKNRGSKKHSHVIADLIKIFLVSPDIFRKIEIKIQICATSSADLENRKLK